MMLFIISMVKKTTQSAMEQLLMENEELSTIPKPGDTLTGAILEKTSNSMFVDLDSLGVGAIYGKELQDDIETFRNAKIGDTIQATIVTFDNEDGYVELSLRSATMDRSWEELRRKYNEESPFPAEIVDANKGGLIVRISGISGFLPVSQLAPDHYPRVEG